MRLLFLFLLLSFGAFAQKDTTNTIETVVKIGDVFYIQSKTVTITFRSLDAQILQSVDTIEAETLRKDAEKLEAIERRKKLVKLLKDADKAGYKPKSDNEIDKAANYRIMNKIKKEKL